MRLISLGFPTRKAYKSCHVPVASRQEGEPEKKLYKSNVKYTTMTISPKTT